jgi:CheY-like chemotaxis protein
MKILVIDDKKKNLDSAKELLSDHEVTTVQTYDEGLGILDLRYANKMNHGFDVVLVDLLMPASNHKQGHEGAKFIGQEMPIGIFLALLAAQYGAKYVAVFSDTNHHDHPASACFDSFHKGVSFLPYVDEKTGETICDKDEHIVLRVNDAKLILTNKESWIETAKNWRKVLDYLLTC